MILGTMTLAFLVLQGITPKPQTLSLLHLIAETARQDASNAGANTSGVGGINLESFLVLARSASSETLNPDEVGSAIADTFVITGAGDAFNCELSRAQDQRPCSMKFPYYLELNGVFVTPAEAEAIVTIKWVASTSRGNWPNLRTLRLRFEHKHGEWVKLEETVLLQS